MRALSSWELLQGPRHLLEAGLRVGLSGGPSTEDVDLWFWTISLLPSVPPDLPREKISHSRTP